MVDGGGKKKRGKACEPHRTVVDVAQKVWVSARKHPRECESGVSELTGNRVVMIFGEYMKHLLPGMNYWIGSYIGHFPEVMDYANGNFLTINILLWVIFTSVDGSVTKSCLGLPKYVWCDRVRESHIFGTGPNVTWGCPQWLVLPKV